MFSIIIILEKGTQNVEYVKDRTGMRNSHLIFSSCVKIIRKNQCEKHIILYFSIFVQCKENILFQGNEECDIMSIAKSLAFF